MDFELTTEQKRIQALAREFAEQEVAPIAREADEKGEFPMHLVQRMGERGFLAGPLEREYGGGRTGFVRPNPRREGDGWGGPWRARPPPVYGQPGALSLASDGDERRVPPGT